MAEDRFTTEESRKLAVLIARSWADPQLGTKYQDDPEAVLAGAGIALAGRTAPELPGRPGELVGGEIGQTARAFSSASSLSTVTCPCTGCTASCAGLEAVAVTEAQFSSMVKLAEEPGSREEARKMTSSWGLSIEIHP
jgi:hypothetical protein